MSALINSYLACHLINLDEKDRADGPFVVVQEAYDPKDELMITTLFLMRRDGTWVDEILHSELPDEKRFAAFFDSSNEAVLALESLRGDPVIEYHNTTVQELRTRLADLKAGTYAPGITALVGRYRMWKQAGHRRGF